MVSKGNRVFLVTFAATLIILSAAAVYLIYLPQAPTVQHLPVNLHVEASDWMKYAPPDAEKVYVMNFTRIREEVGDLSLFSTDRLLTLYGYTTVVKLDSSYYSITALFPSGDPTSNDIALNIIEVSPLSVGLPGERTGGKGHSSRLLSGSHHSLRA